MMMKGGSLALITHSDITTMIERLNSYMSCPQIQVAFQSSHVSNLKSSTRISEVK